jgi:hypothetical protein
MLREFAPTQDTSTVILVDPRESPALCKHIQENPGAYTLVNGAVCRSGTPILESAHLADPSDSADLAPILKGLREYLKLTTPTQAQSTAALRRLIRMVAVLYRSISEME